jgi:hypothetical protein
MFDQFTEAFHRIVNVFVVSQTQLNHKQPPQISVFDSRKAGAAITPRVAGIYVLFTTNKDRQRRFQE